MEKIFILNAHIENCLEIADRLVSVNDDLDVANIFISDEEKVSNKHFYYQDNEKIGLDYLNNSLLFVNNVSNLDYINYGVTLDELYNSDVICLEYGDFLNISDYLLFDIKPLIVWVDNSFGNVTSEKYFNESAFSEIVYNINTNMLYFTSDDNYDNIVSVVNEYICADDERKKELLEENS